VRLLEGVRELRVAEAAEQRRVGDHVDQLAITLHQFLLSARIRVSPYPARQGLVRFVQRDAAELGQHDRLAAMRIAVEGEDAPAGTAAVEQLLELDLRPIALAQMLRA